jgi:V8-like Glu-specific endopeptidase
VIRPSGRFFRINILLLSFCLTPTLAPAIVVRHDRDATLFEQLGREYPSTAMLRHGDGKDGLGGEGTLINRNWVLTAAHVAADLGPGDPVTILGKIYKIGRVVIYPDWHQDADMPVDLALIRLTASVTDVVPARAYTGTDELGMVATLVGRGQQGTGLTGPLPDEGTLRAATNRVDSTLDVFPGTAARGQYPAEGFQLRFTFDAPGDPNATDLEGICGGGDSGGPAYIKKRNVLYVIGVSSGQDARPANRQVGHYGVFEYYTRVSHFANWIHSVIGN